MSMPTKRQKKEQQTEKSTKVAKTASTTTSAPAINGEQLFADLLLIHEAGGNVDDNAVDCDMSNASTEVNVDESDRITSYTLGERQDRVLIATPDGVTISSASEPSKTMTFDLNRWAHFVVAMAKVDDEAKELNRKTRAVLYRLHLGDGYYVSLTSDIICIDFRRFYLPYGLTSDQLRPTKTGIALRMDEWIDMLRVIPAIHAMFPELATAKRCVDEESHLGQLGYFACRSCFPFGH